MSENESETTAEITGYTLAFVLSVAENPLAGENVFLVSVSNIDGGVTGYSVRKSYLIPTGLFSDIERNPDFEDKSRLFVGMVVVVKVNVSGVILKFEQVANQTQSENFMRVMLANIAVKNQNKKDT